MQLLMTLLSVFTGFIQKLKNPDKASGFTLFINLRMVIPLQPFALRIL
jgi:hypothetical protein